MSQLAETASTWARLVAPLAEWAVKEIASKTKTGRPSGPATRLTQNSKRALTGRAFVPEAKPPVKLRNMCSKCGDEIGDGSARCTRCTLEVSAPVFAKAASEGRAASHTPDAETKRYECQTSGELTGMIKLRAYDIFSRLVDITPPIQGFDSC